MQRRLGIVFALAAFLASACWGDATGTPPRTVNQPYHPQAPQKRGGTVVFSDWEFPDSFNMLAATAATDLRVGSLVFAPLWGLDSALKPYPNLVREVPTPQNGDVKLGADGKSMTVDVKLVPGLKWSDGAPITADDVIFTWQAICDPATQAATTTGFDHIRSMTKRSDTEVIWNFGPEPAQHCGSPTAISSGVYSPYPQMGPVMWLMPRHRLQHVAHAGWVSDAFFGKPDVVSGPFTVSEIIPNDRITLVANPHFADGRSARGAYTDIAANVRFTHAPYLDQLVYRVYGDKAAMIQGLKAGETDVGFHLNVDDVSTLRTFKSSTTSAVGGLEDEYLNPNHSMNSATHRYPPWATPSGDDRPLLDALDLAIDRSALVKQVLDGAARPSNSLFPSAMTHYSDLKTHLASYNVDAARRILDADGWVAGSGGIRAKNGHRLSFTLDTVCTNAQRAKELDFLKRAWSQIGASVSTNCRKRGLFFASFTDGGLNATGAFDMTVYSNAWQPDPSNWSVVGESSQIPSAQNPTGENWNRCRDSTLDHYFRTGDSTLDPVARRDAYLAGEQEWLAYHCTMPLFEWPQVTQVANNLHNFAPNASISMDVWNVADWWISA